MTARPSAYTRRVGLLWQRAVSVVVLVLVAAAPVSATICATLCAPVAQDEMSSTGHHGQHAAEGKHGDHGHHAPVASSADVPDLNLAALGAPPHDGCDGHLGVTDGRIERLAQVRGDDQVSVALQPDKTELPRLSPPTLPRLHSSAKSPPGTPTPTRAPLVLRI